MNISPGIIALFLPMAAQYEQTDPDKKSGEHHRAKIGEHACRMRVIMGDDGRMRYGESRH
jgi:hypothetical protein